MRQDGANLVRDDDGAVEVGGRVVEIVFEHRLTRGARGLAAVINQEALLDFAALLGHAGFDPVDVVADIDAIGDGALVVVFGDAVLVEVGDRLRRGRGGEADEKGVEVFEHLPPEVVDRAVALVGDDEVEFLDRHGGVVGDVARACAAESGGELRAGEIVRALREFFTAQDRIEALDGADGDAAHVVDVRRGQVLDVVELGEQAAGVGRAEAVELVARLFAEIARGPRETECGALWRI